MKAIKIDATEKTVTEVEYDGDYKTIYKLGGFDTFTVIDLGDGETLFIDDNGLLNEENTKFFKLAGPDYKYAQPLAGNGVILGTDDEGESIATKLTVEKVAANVLFKSLQVVDWTPVRTEENADTPFGKGFAIYGAQPIFADAPVEE